MTGLTVVGVILYLLVGLWALLRWEAAQFNEAFRRAFAKDTNRPG